MVSINRAPLAPALHLEVLSDSLAGLNVRPDNYLDPAWSPPARVCGGYPWDDYKPFECWRVFVWEENLDYDEDGNAYWDGPPGDFCASHHRTQRGAEMEAAWLEHHGIEASRITVSWGWTDPCDYNYPLRD